MNPERPPRLPAITDGHEIEGGGGREADPSPSEGWEDAQDAEFEDAVPGTAAPEERERVLEALHAEMPHASAEAHAEPVQAPAPAAHSSPPPVQARSSAAHGGGHGHESGWKKWGGRLGFFFIDLLPRMVIGVVKGIIETVRSKDGKPHGGGAHPKPAGGGGGHH